MGKTIKKKCGKYAAAFFHRNKIPCPYDEIDKELVDLIIKTLNKTEILQTVFSYIGHFEGHYPCVYFFQWKRYRN